MNSFIGALAFALPISLVIFIPIFFIIRKLEQQIQWGVFIALWVMVALFRLGMLNT